MIPINKFPYTSFHEINLNWVIERIQEMYAIIDEKITQALEPVISDVDGLKTRVTTLETNYSSLSATVSDHSTTIEQHSIEIQGLGHNIDGVTADVNELSGIVSGHTTDIIELQGNVTTINTEIVDIYNRIADIDPDTGLIIDATQFEYGNKKADVLDPVYKFEITGTYDYGVYDYPLYPDVLAGGGYYSRVTMQTDAETGKIKLPSELTTGDYPIIKRGTFATNVNTDAEVYAGDPLEYTINGATMTVDGYDTDAIILVCIACIRRNANTYENQFTDGNNTYFKSMPDTTQSSNYKSYSGYCSTGTSAEPLPSGLKPIIFYFDKEGNLLEYVDQKANRSWDIPAGTYSIWYGISTTLEHAAWTNDMFKVYLQSGGGGVYRFIDNVPVSEHIVNFTPLGAPQKQAIIRQNNIIFGLNENEKIDMFTGAFYRRPTPYDDYIHISSFDYDVISNGLDDLTPGVPYNVSLLTGREIGYGTCDLKYNKVMQIINGLDANNTRY